VDAAAVFFEIQTAAACDRQRLDRRRHTGMDLKDAIRAQSKVQFPCIDHGETSAFASDRDVIREVQVSKLCPVVGRPFLAQVKFTGGQEDRVQTGLLVGQNDGAPKRARPQRVALARDKERTALEPHAPEEREHREQQGAFDGAGQDPSVHSGSLPRCAAAPLRCLENDSAPPRTVYELRGACPVPLDSSGQCPPWRRPSRESRRPDAAVRGFFRGAGIPSRL
jgi:hypothetical protein